MLNFLSILLMRIGKIAIASQTERRVIKEILGVKGIKSKEIGTLLKFFSFVYSVTLADTL